MHKLNSSEIIDLLGKCCDDTSHCVEAANAIKAAAALPESTTAPHTPATVSAPPSSGVQNKR